MEMSNLWINVFVVIVVFIVYAMEYLRNGSIALRRPKEAAARVVDPHVFYATRRKASR